MSSSASMRPASSWPMLQPNRATGYHVMRVLLHTGARKSEILACAAISPTSTAAVKLDKARRAMRAAPSCCRDKAVAILRSLPSYGRNPFFFPGRVDGQHLANVTGISRRHSSARASRMCACMICGIRSPAPPSATASSFTRWASCSAIAITKARCAMHTCSDAAMRRVPTRWPMFCRFKLIALMTGFGVMATAVTAEPAAPDDHAEFWRCAELETKGAPQTPARAATVLLRPGCGGVRQWPSAPTRFRGA